ncbi:SsgA family sporulation/cell division regulator [Streptacidiphilus neutrinimicus]|uniref:SsgA family sporulation/cell division regulator n=1 Tax=Streptacidiphilus neutrinimicus TaxID=105420 RepID=UPI000694E4A5|nr:SsgA family sporulation/cell division regulator [Streptacidiphilus neutrinimicus]
MPQLPARISHSAPFSLAGHTSPYPLQLTYSSETPWQVAIDFPREAVTDRRPARWVVGRELLLDGLAAPCGEGDVRVWPQGRSTVLELRTRTGSAVLTVRAAALREFLNDTYALVPGGREADHVDWDAVVTQLQER